MKVVSERLGHSTTSITADLYQHVAPHMQEEAANKLGAMLLRRPERGGGGLTVATGQDYSAPKAAGPRRL